ncbi:MAG: hypothetical protein P8H57_07780 [Emcibacteraceae bacterium]|jgi:hypothetical protein|nr:hypothetical protein [Kordiimonadaceae bacterium]MDA7568557.1 hypothetical protein [Emcibacteraceae bacterium]MDG1019853.1 hypothetical protein [Emcibacteraceae bacterium]MDG1727038.1 hypothetical protein [Emcibacteraceae bacterium]
MKNQPQKKKHFHMIINIALTAFLMFTATVGMRGLTYTGDQNISAVSEAIPQLENVMICAIGQCILK